MGSHSPSSPITSEHPTDDLELKLKQHGLQTASQVASTSRSTLDSPDTARTSEIAPNQNVAAHTPFSDWQEQRRCHSILAEYDYVQPTEDRRDPRSSNARLVMPVSTQQPQVMVTNAAHDVHSSEGQLQQPPIALHRDANTVALPSTSTICAEATIGNADHHGASAQSALSQPSTSVPPSPERGVSPSPSYSDFDYAAQSSRVSRVMPSSLPRPRPETIEEERLRDLETSPCPAPYASRQAQDDRCSRDQGVSQQQSTQATGESVGFATADSHSWLKMPSVHFDETSMCTSVSPSRSTTCDARGKSPLSQKVFQLQPVPPAKRRRVEDHVPAGTQSVQLSTNVVEEVRRSSDAGISFSTAPAQPSTIQGPTSIQTDAAVQRLSSTTESRHSASRVAAADSVPAPVHRALGTSSRVNLAVFAAGPKVDAMNTHRTNASNRNTQAENASSLASLVPPRKQHASPSRRPSRLIRAQSVPNLRAKATLDVSGPSHHRLILPSHWASYVSLHGRTGRAGQNGVAKGSNSRSSKAFPFNVAHNPTATSSSRSRSTFTPTLHPPITRHTLRELDLFEILKNPQLRHDVVFDPNVQFRPNFDGERGRRKREAGERYWTAVVREIETGCTCTAFSHGQLMPCTCKARQRLSKPSAGRSTAAVPASMPQSRIPSRIPLLVQELRTICLSILPSNYPADNEVIESDGASTSSVDNQQSVDADESKLAASSEKKLSTSASSGPALATTHHQLIAQTLDPHLISQELQHGVLDVSALITFMGNILKLHCAPMRDEAIEKMVEVVCVDRNIGKGLRLCFEILELMKLDIANHQLRSARPFLVETAVDFEARWFKEQIEQGKMSLDKTNAWIQQALTTTLSSNSASSRSEAVVSAFNHGMLQLIFDVPGSLPVLAPVATPLASPSSSSLNNTFASHYPETFQFDAYRMMTFHNDVSDLTIVYMLVLLFRQLCSTPLDDAGPLPASVSGLVQRQLKSIKGEIWCLVNDANLCLSGSSVLPASPTAAANSVGSSSRRSAGLDGKLSLGSAGGFAKLDHPRWRRAMQNVLLQVAARASAVQMAARAGSSDPTTVKATAPSAATQKLLNSWTDTNLRSGSALHKICQSRLRDVVLSMLSEKVRTGLQPSTSVSCTTTGDLDQPSGRPHQKRTNSSSHHEQDSAKRSKSDIASGSASASINVVPAASASAAAPWDTAMTRAGLEPFSAEIRLLSDRIAKVATFHLRVFRNLYEGIESARHKTSSTESA